MKTGREQVDMITLNEEFGSYRAVGALPWRACERVHDRTRDDRFGRKAKAQLGYDLT